MGQFPVKEKSRSRTGELKPKLLGEQLAMLTLFQAALKFLETRIKNKNTQNFHYKILWKELKGI